MNRTAYKQFKEYFLQRYSHLNRTDVHWQKVLNTAAAGLEEETTTAGFAAKLVHLLEPAQDGHLWVKYQEDLVRTAPPRLRTQNFNFKTIDAQLQNRSASPLGVVVSGKVQETTGYIRINSWNANLQEEIASATEQLRQMGQLPYLIIDVRANAGGDDRLAQEFASHFFTEAKAYERLVLFDEKKKKFDKVQLRTISPATDFQYKGKVLVLMGSQNASSCESFLFMMKQLPQAQLVGERSMGSSGNPQVVTLANGVEVYVPSWRATDLNGLELEGRGVAPTTEAVFPAEAFMTADPVFEKALALLNVQ